MLLLSPFLVPPAKCKPMATLSPFKFRKIILPESPGRVNGSFSDSQVTSMVSSNITLPIWVLIGTFDSPSAVYRIRPSVHPVVLPILKTGVSASVTKSRIVSPGFKHRMSAPSSG